jgi:predicted metalloprotease with PDZ domain
LDADVSRGPVTARAVGIMRKLDLEIHRKTNHEHSLDDVTRLLVTTGQKLNIERLRHAVAEIMGEPAESLEDHQLD